MIRRVPVVATLIVLAAVGAMIALGIWQLQRKAWKEGLLVRYEQAAGQHSVLAVAGPDLPEAVAYRHIAWDCPNPGVDQVVGGRSGDGQSGWAHVALCVHRAGSRTTVVPVVLGWSSTLTPVSWSGGEIEGVVVPGPKSGVALAHDGVALPWHIVADPPLAGLAANAAPDPRDIPNNHFGYAIQWFLFAGIALVIYALALWRR